MTGARGGEGVGARRLQDETDRLKEFSHARGLVGLADKIYKYNSLEIVSISYETSPNASYT